VLLLIAVRPASAITIPLSSFFLTNTNADGSVMPAGDISFLLLGGNDGSGNQGETDYTTAAPSAFTVSFNYSYSTLDYPFYDSAGFQVAGTLFPLADMDGVSGMTSFDVLAGQSFGWWVTTFDNLGEPGMLSVTNLTYSGSDVGTAPEPASFILAGLAMLLVLFVWDRITREEPRQ
jgi:hypothetical protein